jgi:hypothetical protein
MDAAYSVPCDLVVFGLCHSVRLFRNQTEIDSGSEIDGGNGFKTTGQLRYNGESVRQRIT